jgi:DNA-binding CsgD family transcriptional regulator
MNDVQTAVGKFREAAMLPLRWPQALESLACALGSDGASVVLAPTTESTLLGSSSLAWIIQDYFRSPIPDPRETRVSPGLRDQFMPDFAYFSRQEISRDAYYQEFLAPRGLMWNATAALGRGLLISLKRGKHRGPYEGADLAALNGSLSRLRAASRIASLSWRSQFSGRLSAFERLGHGALLIDAQGRLLESNASVRFGDGLDVVGGRLTTTRIADRPALERFLSAVIQGGANAPAASTTLALAHKSGPRPLVIDGIACTDAMRSLHSRAAALLLVTDLDRRMHVSDAILKAVFALTTTEARLARQLADGSSLREASMRLGISEGHARQRLKSVFVKTGTKRQGELVMLLAKLGDRGSMTCDRASVR